jgi:hypothetical protein
MADDEENLDRFDWQHMADTRTIDLTQLEVGHTLEYGVVGVCPGFNRNGVRSSEVVIEHLLDGNHPAAHIGGPKHPDAVLDCCCLDNGVWKSCDPATGTD